MATTVATVVTDVKDRMLVTAASSEPTDGMIGNWIRSAAKYAIGALQPPMETTVSVTSGPQASLTADQVYYVANDYEILLPVEWAKQGATIQLQPQAAASGDTIQVWYFLDPNITSATTEFDTTCIFGADWLEEAITLMACQQVEMRRSMVAPSADGTGHAAMIRVLQDERERLLTPYRRTRDTWVAEMDGRLQMRASLGNPAFRQSPYNKFRNRSMKTNRMTGIG